MYELFGWFIDKILSLLEWLSKKQVWAARLRIHSDKSCLYRIRVRKDMHEKALLKLEEEETELLNEITLMQDFLDTPAKGL